MAKVAPFETVVPAPAQDTMIRVTSNPDEKKKPSKPYTRQLTAHNAVIIARHELKEVMVRSGWYDSAAAHKLRRFLKGTIFAIAAVIALFLALFASEVFALCQVPTNLELDIILTGVLIVFGGEFLGLLLTDTSYLFSFFFWMDLIGTLSMFFDISYVSPFVDVEQPYKAGGGSSNNIIVVRAVRAAKLGARAGRIGRGIKMVLPFLDKDKDNAEKKVKMAKVISNQLTNVLSTRVAFLTIMIVVSMPFLSLYAYPTDDVSLDSWTTLLNRNAKIYLDADGPANKAAAMVRMEKALRSFDDFYSGIAYGPFAVCIGQPVGDDFRCDPSIHIVFNAHFEEPDRKNSIMQIDAPHLQAKFNLKQIKQQESASSIALLVFVILVMVVFGLLLSSSISVIALQPLERMLAVIREHCATIFQYTNVLQEDEENESEEDQDYDDMDQASEFKILERVVEKLTGIIKISTAANLEQKENMNEDDIMALNYANGGAGVPQAKRADGSHNMGEDDCNMPHDGPGWSILQTVPMEIIDALEGPHFNALDLSKEHSISTGVYIIAMSEGASNWVHSHVKESHLVKFVTVCESKYPPNPFHNFGHGLDVLYSVNRFMRLVCANGFLGPSAQFGLTISSVGHDLGHLGVNNNYLIEIAHELAVRYNDRSPLENMHCATLFQVVSDPEANIFAQLEKDVYKDMRKSIINMILHTDVVKHNEMIKELNLLYQMSSDSFDNYEPSEPIQASPANVQTILNCFLHTADIANPMKPFELAKPLAYLCVDEFFAQGDMEKAAGIPVQMLNDRDKVNRPNSQLGFLEFVILPLVEAVVSIFPQLDSLADNLGANLGHWSEIWIAEVHPPEESAAKVKARVQKANTRCRNVTQKERGLEF